MFYDPPAAVCAARPPPRVHSARRTCSGATSASPMSASTRYVQQVGLRSARRVERGAGKGLQSALARGNPAAGHPHRRSREGRTGQTSLLARRVLAEGPGRRGWCRGSTAHPLGYHGHAAGPAHRAADMQDGVPAWVTTPLYPDTCHAIELGVQSRGAGVGQTIPDGARGGCLFTAAAPGSSTADRRRSIPSDSSSSLAIGGASRVEMGARAPQPAQPREGHHRHGRALSVPGSKLPDRGCHHLHGDEPACRRARRHRPLAGLPRLRLRSRTGRRGHTSAMQRGNNQYAPMPVWRRSDSPLPARIERLYGARYDPETEITVTSGATEALFCGISAFVRPGDEVILFEPCFRFLPPGGSVERRRACRRHAPVPGIRIDWDDSATGVDTTNPPDRESTRPTTRPGRSWTRTTWPCWRRWSTGRRSSCSATRSTSTSSSTGSGTNRVPDPALASRGAVVSSFGKSYPHTGWKVGYLAAPKAITTEIRRLHQFVTFATHNAEPQHAYAAVMERRTTTVSWRGSIRAKRDLFSCWLLAESRFRPVRCRGTYFQLLDYLSGDRHDAPDHDGVALLG